MIVNTGELSQEKSAEPRDYFLYLGKIEQWIAPNKAITKPGGRAIIDQTRRAR